MLFKAYCVSLKMSLSSSHHCLFCKHQNPAGATFCNECGTQLNLQPCNHCGAVNFRAARNCQQCHLELMVQAPPQSGDSAEPKTARKPAMRLAPTDSAVSAGAPAAKPDAEAASSPAERFIESYDPLVRHDLEPAPSPDKFREPNRVVAPKANETASLWRKPLDEGAKPTASPEMDETLSLWHRLQNHGSEPIASAEVARTAGAAGAPTEAARRKLYLSASVVLLAIAAAGTGYYFYSKQPALLARQQGPAPSESVRSAETVEKAEAARSVVPERPASASPALAARSDALARPAEPASRPATTAATTTANAEQADAAPVRAASSAVVSARPSTPADAPADAPPDTAVPARREAPRSNACPPAVATLGLCDPGTN